MWLLVLDCGVGNAKIILDIEDGVSWVHGSLVLCRLTDQTFLVGEGDERRSGEATLLVGNDLDIGSLIVGHCYTSVLCLLADRMWFRGVVVVNVPQE